MSLERVLLIIALVLIIIFMVVFMFDVDFNGEQVEGAAAFLSR